VLYFEDLSIGQSAEIAREVTFADIEAFAQVSGDFNPVHLDADYAATTPFGERIAHGMLAGAFISAVMASKLPGPGAVYRSQSMKFRRPVKIGDVVVARATITALDERRGVVTLETLCLVGDVTVVEGEATVIAPRRPAG
jgi:3-hydroxybutyryl-CoA dehydratase